MSRPSAGRAPSVPNQPPLTMLPSTRSVRSPCVSRIGVTFHAPTFVNTSWRAARSFAAGYEFTPKPWPSDSLVNTLMSGVSRSPGSGRTRAASTSPKIVAFTRIAIASEAIATSANNGRRWSTRTARRRFPGSQDRGTVSVPALLVHDATVEQMDRPLGVTREPRIVRDHADRAALLVQVTQQVHHGLAVRRVQ